MPPRKHQHHPWGTGPQQKQDLRRRFVARARVYGMQRARVDYHLTIVAAGKWWRQFKKSLPIDFPREWAEVDPDLQEYAKALAHANGYVSDELRFQEEWQAKRHALVVAGETVAGSEQVVVSPPAAMGEVSEASQPTTVEAMCERVVYKALETQLKLVPFMQPDELNETIKTVSEFALASRVMSVRFDQAQVVLVEARKAAE